MTYSYKTSCIEETEALGFRFSSCLKAGDVVAMYGNLGAGKTAFVRGVLHGLGYEGSITSPTFAIVNEYTGSKLTVDHFDVYRIDNEDELYSTGFYDYLDGKRVLFIEWSENIPFAVDEDAIRLTIRHKGGDNREITIESPREMTF